MDVAAGSAGFKNISSPIPPLFGGLAFMLGVIAVALLILACSYRNQHSSSTSQGNEEKPSKTTEMEVDNSEPKIVVIMAGDSNPTYLAKPVSSTCHTEESV